MAMDTAIDSSAVPLGGDGDGRTEAFGRAGLFAVRL